MREIKFRAWNKRDKFMQDVGELIWLNGGLQAFDQGTHIANDWVTVNKDCAGMEKIEPEVILMQFTGLKDKNGKEIYEGDIVRHLIKPPHELSGIHEIVFSDGAFKIKGGNPHGTRYGEAFNYYPMNVEIIGNIYETPALLNQKGKEI